MRTFSEHCTPNQRKFTKNSQRDDTDTNHCLSTTFFLFFSRSLLLRLVKNSMRRRLVWLPQNWTVTTCTCSVLPGKGRTEQNYNSAIAEMTKHVRDPRITNFLEVFEHTMESMDMSDDKVIKGCKPVHKSTMRRRQLYLPHWSGRHWLIWRLYDIPM